MPVQKTAPASQKLLLILLSICLLLLIIGMQVSSRSRGIINQPQQVRDNQHPSLYSRSFLFLETYVQLRFWAPEPPANAAADAITVALQQFQQRIDLKSSHSELSRLNAEAGQQPFICSNALWQLLLAARQVYADTDGLVDISIAPLLRLWEIHVRKQIWPSDAAIAETRAAVGLGKIRFDDHAQSVHFSHAHTSLDMRGIAKGYALEMAASIAAAHNLHSGTIEIGSSMTYCLPKPPPRKNSYRINISNPFDRSNHIGSIDVSNATIASCGGSENIHDLQGGRLQAIIDPRSGHALTQIGSVTVVSNGLGNAEALATAIFIGGDSMIAGIRARYPELAVLQINLDDSGSTVMHQHQWHWWPQHSETETEAGYGNDNELP